MTKPTILVFLLLAFFGESISAVAAEAKVCDATLQDAARANREVPVRVRLPAVDGPTPIVIFSHGLGGNVDAGTRWAEAWLSAGIAVIHVQHRGSDESIWRGRPPGEIAASLKKAMTAEQLVARFGDVAFVIDNVDGGASIGDCALSRVDRSRIGVAGHSFGAHTALGVAGQRFPVPRKPRGVDDPRVRAVIALSPSPPASGTDAEAFGAMSRPVMSITGTEDSNPAIIAAASPMDPKDRVRPYFAMPPGGKYLLVFEGADHAVFSGNNQRRRASANDERVSAIVEEVTTRFWNQIFDPQSSALILPPTALAVGDRWEAK